MRRRFQTRSGHEVALVRLQVASPYFGAVEITRMETATRFILDRARGRGELIIGIDPEAPPRQLPPEEVVAELHSHWLPASLATEDREECRTQRVLRFYQDDGADPFMSLSAIVEGLDWPAVAKLDHWG